LFERTEGWPAAIYLVALSLQNREDRHAFIESFGGSNRYIVALLVEEVLADLPEETRNFLLRTSVLRRMTGTLCDAVVGRNGSGLLLRELAQSNLFVVPLGDGSEWYRYHHLFSDLLLYELRSSRPELVPTLHRRASEWLEEAGLFDPAIRHALAAADYEHARLLIARHWFKYVFAGQTVTVERWLEAFPEGFIGADAALALVKSWISALYGRREEAERFLKLAEGDSHNGRLPDGTASVKAGANMVRGVFGYRGVQSTLEAAQGIAALEPELTSPRAALLRFVLGGGLYFSGDTAQARKPLEEALDITKDGQPLLRMVLLSYLSFIATDEGHLEKAESLAREARALVYRFGLRKFPQSSLAHTALGRALEQRGKPEEAQKELEGGLSARRRLPGLSPWPTLLGLLALAQVNLAHGNRAAGRAVLAEARYTLEPFADDAGIFPELLERQERKLRARKPREGQLDGELTNRELDVLRLLNSELSTRQMAQNLYVATDTVRTHIKSIYRKLGVSSREEAVEEAHARDLL
jgi:LuxR family maltose regulon positive regulatory protein